MVPGVGLDVLKARTVVDLDGQPRKLVFEV